jgi:magnesium transporter
MTFRLFDVTAAHGFRQISAKDAAALDPDAVSWLDVLNPSAEEIRSLGTVFGFHPLALEDVLKRKQRPKVEVYPAHLFVVLYAIEASERFERPTMVELSMFITKHSVVTVHRAALDDLDVAFHRWVEHCSGGSPDNPSMLAYTICDTLVDGYFPVIDAIGDTIELLEAAVFESTDTSTLQEVFRLKRVLLDMRRAVAPTRDVFNAFTRRELPLLGEVSITYFQDVYDHVIRVTDAVDSYRDILSSVIDVHLTLVSNNLNQTVRTLTVASIILMTLGLIAGIYGMNFDNMPELHWHYGYFGVLAAMVVVSILLGLGFRRMRWW